MAFEWREWCKQKRFPCSQDEVEIRLGTGRSQRVRVEDRTDCLLLTSVVTKQASTAQMENPSIEAWKRNRAVSLAGFRIDEKGRLVAHSWVPKAGLTSDEFGLVLEHLASECDRFEFQLTGQDRE